MKRFAASRGEKVLCGAKLRGSDPPRYCRKPAMRGRTRCRLHGGRSPRGNASPHFKTGAYVPLYRDVLPPGSGLLESYEHLRTDEHLTSLREEIAVSATRSRELLRRAVSETGENGEAWQEWERNAYLLVRLKDGEQKHLEREQTAMSIDKVYTLVGLVGALACRFIRDREDLAAFEHELSAIIEGEPMKDPALHELAALPRPKP
jgi:hypothetical protein